MASTGSEASGDTPETAAWLRAELNDLDDEVYTGTAEPAYNALMSLYLLLPEHRIVSTIGSEIDVVFDDDDYMRLLPVSAYGNYFIARDIDVSNDEQDEPGFVVLGGSVLLDEPFVDRNGPELLKPAISKVVNCGLISDTHIPELNTGFIYRPGVFCRGARLAIAQAYTMDELYQTHVKVKTRREGMNGTVITVGLNGEDLVLFVESEFGLTEPIQQVEVGVDDEYIPVLPFVTDDD